MLFAHTLRHHDVTMTSLTLRRIGAAAFERLTQLSEHLYYSKNNDVSNIVLDLHARNRSNVIQAVSQVT